MVNIIGSDLFVHVFESCSPNTLEIMAFREGKTVCHTGCKKESYSETIRSLIEEWLIEANNVYLVDEREEPARIKQVYKKGEKVTVQNQD